MDKRADVPVMQPWPAGGATTHVPAPPSSLSTSLNLVGSFSSGARNHEDIQACQIVGVDCNVFSSGTAYC